MSRQALEYCTQKGEKSHSGVDVSTPCEGYYRHRMRSGAVYGGVHIWFGPPFDPVTGEEMDRSWRWQAKFNGQPIDLDYVWPVCASKPISKPEYERYCQQQEWAQEYAPDSAYADPKRRIDPLSMNEPLPF